MARAAAMTVDMTNVKEGGQFNKKRQPEGDYKAKIVSVESVQKKDDKSKKMWLFTIKAGSGVYPFYCGFGEKELWKIRNLWAACGKNIPKKRVKLDPNTVVGREIGVTLQDTEYEGKLQSEIGATFPVSELAEYDDSDVDDEDEDDEDEDVEDSSDDDDEDDEEEDDEDEDEEDEDEEDEEDEDEEDEDEEEEPEPPKRRVKKKPAPAKKAAPAKSSKKKKRKSSEVTDDELEELDIEDV